MRVNQFIAGGSQVRWLVPGLLPRGMLGLVAGKPGHGKSLFLEHLALAVASGSKLFDHFGVEQGAVLLIDNDTPTSLLQERLAAMKTGTADPPLVVYSQTGITLDTKDGLRQLTEWVQTAKPVLAIVDTLDTCTTADFNENRVSPVAKVMDPLRDLAEHHDLTFLISHHLGKRAREDDPIYWIRGSSSLAARVDFAFGIRSTGRLGGLAKTFGVFGINKRVKVPDGFQIGLATSELDGKLLSMAVRYAGPLPSSLDVKDQDDDQLVLAVVNALGDAGATVKEIRELSGEYLTDRRIRESLDRLKEAGAIRSQSEAHNMFRFWPVEQPQTTGQDGEAKEDEVSMPVLGVPWDTHD